MACVLTAAVLCAAAPARGDWIRELKVTFEPPVDGQQDVTIRITPGRTGEFDEFTFDCVLHQEFPWVNARGRAYTKIHEPVVFQHREHPVRLVNDLDRYISFRVPVGRARLEEMYGATMFNRDYPVCVSKIRIAAVAAGAKAWSCDIGTNGTYIATNGTLVLQPAAVPSPASAAPPGAAAPATEPPSDRPREASPE
jgi:hypothetical protein